jgi:hypothetical protein
LGKKSGMPAPVSGEIEILADLAVVPGFRLLQPPEVSIELLLRRPRRTVDAGEHRVLLVTPPVGPRYVLQLESAEPARTGDVRAAAKIEEISLFVDRDLTVFQALDYLRFVGVVYVEVLSFDLGDLLPLYREVPGDDLAHPLFYAWQILVRELSRYLDVVEEAVLYRRADCQLASWIEFYDGLRHRVRSRMPEHLEAL